jgi:hypothetical protein
VTADGPAGTVGPTGESSGGPLHLPPLSLYLAPRVDQSYARGLWSVGRARLILRAVGPWNFLKRLVEHPSLPWIRYGGKPLTALGRRVTGRTTFQFSGQTYPYPAWNVHGERRVEIPVALAYLNAHGRDGGRALEVGNVLHQGTSVPRTVLDKYEKGPGILNEDIVDYAPPTPYDLVLAISTLEHVGFDEDRMDLGKFQRAVEHLYDRCLAAGGRMLISVPLGYHPEVDRLVLGDHLGWGEISVMVHCSALGEWKEVPVADLARSGPPMYPYERHRAAGVAFWTVRKPGGLRAGGT